MQKFYPYNDVEISGLRGAWMLVSQHKDGSWTAVRYWSKCIVCYVEASQIRQIKNPFAKILFKFDGLSERFELFLRKDIPRWFKCQ